MSAVTSGAAALAAGAVASVRVAAQEALSRGLDNLAADDNGLRRVDPPCQAPLGQTARGYGFAHRDGGEPHTASNDGAAACARRSRLCEQLAHAEDAQELSEWLHEVLWGGQEEAWWDQEDWCSSDADYAALAELRASGSGHRSEPRRALTPEERQWRREAERRAHEAERRSREEAERRAREEAREAERREEEEERRRRGGAEDFFMDDTWLGDCAGAPGLAWRRSKDLEDRCPEVARWGEEVAGADEGDGWLRAGCRYLPMALCGAPVLRRLRRSAEATAELDVSDLATGLERIRAAQAASAYLRDSEAPFLRTLRI